MDETPLVERATALLVRSMTSDDAPLWRVTLDGFAALFTDAGHVAAAELERSRTEVAARPGLAAEATGEWKPKLRRLLAADPEAADRLRALLRDLDTGRPRDVIYNHMEGGVAGIAIQVGRVSGGFHSHHEGDHLDFSQGTFHDKVVGKEEHHHEDTQVDQDHRDRRGRE
ncbi:hypothetical protein DFP74_5032 [Nocardiopsis sp. Huas11]|uniref:hypothetical protein n=1 Tax=Nocardiopsis sp. Huas11 TaxID=2183912 RepID=UPI000EAC67F2|nr:hypothetical protein [Nocardiopsis sp. Huas11]RKS09297.1 hypothetical protein DFP74_5032 [Nocardiopsis sp. Huas11]